MSTGGPWFARVGCRAQSALSGAIHAHPHPPIKAAWECLVRARGELVGAKGKGGGGGLGIG